MTGYQALVDEARQRFGIADQHHQPGPAAGRPSTADSVQLSVRLPLGLREAVSSVASRRGQTLTAFVCEVLDSAVALDADPFAGLAADLAAHARTALAEALDDGSYAEAAAAVDAEERAWSGS